MNREYANDVVTVTLSRQDFENMIANALDSIVREPYDQKIVVDSVGRSITDDNEGWFVDYHLVPEEKK